MNLTEAIQANIIPIASAAGGFVVGLAVGLLCGCSRRGGRRHGAKKFKDLPPGMVEIYVGNLSYDTTEEFLRKEFEKHGAVSSLRIVTNHFNHKSKGFGFVEMPNRAEAEKAIAALDNAEIQGRRLHVNEARNNKN